MAEPRDERDSSPEEEPRDESGSFAVYLSFNLPW
jgi:hypothetical protein